MTNNIREIEQWYVPQDLEDKMKESSSDTDDKENEKENNII